MLAKDDSRGLCPFRKFKECNPKCTFYRKGMRFADGQLNAQAIPFESCAINIMADNLEAIHNRTYMLQKEVGDTKNVVIQKTLIDVYKDNPAQMMKLVEELLRMIDFQGRLQRRLTENG